MIFYDIIVPSTGKNANEDAQLIISEHPRSRLEAMSIEDIIQATESGDFGNDIRGLIRKTLIRKTLVKEISIRVTRGIVSQMANINEHTGVGRRV